MTTQPDKTDIQINKVLVVDDEENMRRALYLHLNSENLIVETASDGNSAIKKLRDTRKNNHPFDLVIADVLMPGMKGTILLDWIKTHQPDISVLVISGCPAKFLDLSHIRPDMDAFLAKPFEPWKLREYLVHVFLNTVTYKS